MQKGAGIAASPRVAGPLPRGVAARFRRPIFACAGKGGMLDHSGHRGRGRRIPENARNPPASAACGPVGRTRRTRRCPMPTRAFLGTVHVASSTCDAPGEPRASLRPRASDTAANSAAKVPRSCRAAGPKARIPAPDRNPKADRKDRFRSVQSIHRPRFPEGTSDRLRLRKALFPLRFLDVSTSPCRSDAVTDRESRQ